MTNILPREKSPTPTPASPVATEAPIAPEVRPKKEKRKAGLGTWALVLGIIGIIFAFIPNASGFGIFLGVMAVILGIIGLLRKRDRALAGTILGLVALILGIIFVSVYSSSSSVSPAPAAGSSKATASPAAPAAPAAPTGTAAQLQALTAAKGYLISGIGFSQASLLAQLTSSSGSGFTQADAQYGVDHSGTDWNAQAAIAAKA